MSQDETAVWHHQPKGHEPGQTSGGGEGQGGLARCGPWGCKELDISGRLNNKSATILDLVSFSSKPDSNLMKQTPL